MGLQSDTERKGEVKVANSNSHYWKINISISDHGDFLNCLPCPWTRHSTFLVTFSYFYSSTCKLEKHPRKDPQRSCHELSWLTLIMKVAQRKRKPTILSSELILNADTFVQFFHQVWQHGQITITMPLIAWLTREDTPISAKQAFHFRSCWQHESPSWTPWWKAAVLEPELGW